MLVGTHNGGIDHRVFVVGVLGQMVEDALPYAAPSPAVEPGVHHAEVAKPFWQITPRNPGAITVQDCIDKQTVIHSWTADRTTPARQKLFDPFPLIVSQSVTFHSHALKLLRDQPHAYS
jgi:hypothetical protein